MPNIGMNLRVTTDSKQGGRKYMEDVLSVRFEKGKNGEEIEFAFLGVYDGHGGAEASKFAKQHLLGEITKQRGFWSNDDVSIMRAIKEGFLSTHRMMAKDVVNWPKTVSGLPSTSGSTCSVVFIRDSRMYVGHVGDSGVVLGLQDAGSDQWRAHCVTVDHKPEAPRERKRIEQGGGSVVAKAGVQRVVWNRPKLQHKGPVRRSTHIDRIPFLAVARSLGDLWSYNSASDAYVVSPEPDVCTYQLDLRRHRCLILATDGLWNMLRPQEAVNLVQSMERSAEQKGQDGSGLIHKPAVALVRSALFRWADRNMRADNTSVVVAMFDPPGPSKKAALSTQASYASSSTCLLSDGEEEDSLSSEGSDSEPSGHSSPELTTPEVPKPKPCPLVRPALKRTPQKCVLKPGLPPSEPPKSAPPKLSIWNPKRSMGTGLTRSLTKGRVETSRLTPTFDQDAHEMNTVFPENSEDSDGENQSKPQQEKVDIVFYSESPWRAPLNAAPKRPTPQDSETTSSSTDKPRTPKSKETLEFEGLVSNGSKPSASKSLQQQFMQSPSVKVAKPSPSNLPKEATSPKSPLKLETSMLHSSPPPPMVSPLWPHDLDIEMEVEIDCGDGEIAMLAMQQKSGARSVPLAETNSNCSHGLPSGKKSPFSASESSHCTPEKTVTCIKDKTAVKDDAGVLLSPLESTVQSSHKAAVKRHATSPINTTVAHVKRLRKTPTPPKARMSAFANPHRTRLHVKGYSPRKS